MVAVRTSQLDTIFSVTFACMSREIAIGKSGLCLRILSSSSPSPSSNSSVTMAPWRSSSKASMSLQRLSIAEDMNS